MTPEALLCLSLAIYHESRDQPLDGQFAVAEVVLRRFRDPRWPDDVCSVVFQPHQFEWSRLPWPMLVPKDQYAYSDALAIAQAASLLPTGWGAATRCADHFHSQMERLPRFAQTYRLEKKIGGHWFYCSDAL